MEYFLIFFGLILYIGYSQYLLSNKFLGLSKRIDKIKVQCKFEKNNTDDIRSDIENLTNEIYKIRYGDKHGKNVLIFDNENWSKEKLKSIVRGIDKCCNIRTSDNMNNAMYHLKNGKIDIVFADLCHGTNKNDDGHVLYRLIEEQGIKTDFVLYSGGPRPEDYTGKFIDKFEIIKSPNLLIEYF